MPQTNDTDTTRRNRSTTTTIPGRTPPTEEAGAPIVPATPGMTSGPNTQTAKRQDPRTRRRPPAAGERDAPLVPDLRPTGLSTRMDDETTTRTDDGTPTRTDDETPTDERSN